MTYAYRCRDCGAEYEVQQKITDPPHRRHACQDRPGAVGRLERLINNEGGFVLKGGGWGASGYSSTSGR